MADLPALTGLRFFLAIWVIVNHLVGARHVYEPVAQSLPAPAAAVMRAGYLAVPTFFMLSGLVLFRNYGTTRWTGPNLRRYFTGRFARVYPVYLLSLAIVAPFIVRSVAQPKGWLVAMHLTLMQGWFVGHYTVGWNTPAWTLSCEMFFYATFPLLAAGIRGSRWPATLATAAVALALTPLLWYLGVSDQLKPVVHFSDFVMGVAIARGLKLGPGVSAAWLYRIGILGSLALIGYQQYIPEWISLTTVLRPFNALLLLGLALGNRGLVRALSNRVIVYLGKASYAMYILHIPILWWAVSWPRGLVRYGYVALVVAISCLVYRFAEEPANRYLRKRAQK